MKKGITSLSRVISMLLVLNIMYSCSALKKSGYSSDTNSAEDFTISQVISDTLFNSRQSVSLLSLPLKALKHYKLEFAYGDPALVKTSELAQRKTALAAINGGFFDMEKGGSVNYFEQYDAVISKTSSANNRWAKATQLANGAIILTKKGELEIKPAENDAYYETSKEEAEVLVSGPLLLQNSKVYPLPDIAFTHTRHPRTCLCETETATFFIVIDGRSETAQGMNLHEAQQFLLSLGCVDAINLDGGGSTTLWTQDRGIVNHPSDAKGERPVANALLLIRK